MWLPEATKAKPWCQPLQEHSQLHKLTSAFDSAPSTWTERVPRPPGALDSGVSQAGPHLPQTFSEQTPPPSTPQDLSVPVPVSFVPGLDDQINSNT